MAEIENCACGKDHEVMPTDVDTSCGCFTASWLPESEWIVQEGCDHPMFEYELVCRTHKQHEPCRACMREDGMVH